MLIVAWGYLGWPVWEMGDLTPVFAGVGRELARRPIQGMLCIKIARSLSQSECGDDVNVPRAQRRPPPPDQLPLPCVLPAAFVSVSSDSVL